MEKAVTMLEKNPTEENETGGRWIFPKYFCRAQAKITQELNIASPETLHVAQVTEENFGHLKLF